MSEQRLIDAFGVQRQLNMSYHGCGLDGFSIGFRKALGLAIQTIENAPTIDTVRHGKWEPVYKQGILLPDRMVLTSLKCSECGRTVYTAEPYCHCGAKMDGE